MLFQFRIGRFLRYSSFLHSCCCKKMVTSFPMETLFTLVIGAAVVVQTNASIASAVGQCSGFEFFNNTNILGHDLPPASGGRPKAASAAECCGKCQDFGALCGGFTFDYGTCYLKTRPDFHSDPAARQPFKGAVSALAPNGGSTQLPCGNRSSSSAPPLFTWCDLTLSKDARIEALVANLSIPEKVSLVWSVSVGSSSPAIPRIRWPAIKWWHEDCHGAWVPGDKRPMTTWPAPIGVAASFNRSLFRSLGELTSTEGRARSKTQADYWGPNINIYRDPRWGRGQETPGESPTLSGSFGVEFTRAMQGADSSARSGPDYEYLKTSVCLKHFAGYSFEGSGRHTRVNFDATFTQQDMADTYLPAFQASVQQGEASGIMVREGEVRACVVVYVCMGCGGGG